MKYQMKFGMALLVMSTLAGCGFEETPPTNETKGGSGGSSQGGSPAASGGSPAASGGAPGGGSGGSAGGSTGGSTVSVSGGSNASGGTTTAKQGGSTQSGSGGSTATTTTKPDAGPTDASASSGTDVAPVIPTPKSDLPRVIVSSDIGGTDTDDYQSMAHILTYADRLDIEGFVSSPWGGGRAAKYLEAIDAYEKDYPNLKTYANYPTPAALRAVVKQGATEQAPSAGFTTATEGSKWIIDAVHRDDPRPLWLIIWGAIDDLAQVLHDSPDVVNKLRVYWIGGPNKKYSGPAYDYIRANHKNLWIIENNTTYRGFFNGGNTSGDLSNSLFASTHVKGHGAIGAYYWAKRPEIKMGDTPSVLYLLNNTLEDPTKPGWGGQFVPLSGYPTWWTDDQNPSVAEGPYPGAKHVSKWREQFLRDWEPRMDRCVAPKP